jgi:hypothetical protein
VANARKASSSRSSSTASASGDTGTTAVSASDAVTTVESALAAGETVLYYGCRRRDTDALYLDELQRARDDGTLSQLHVRARLVCGVCGVHICLTTHRSPSHDWMTTSARRLGRSSECARVVWWASRNAHVWRQICATFALTQ